jgi:hypothetical protein
VVTPTEGRHQKVDEGEHDELIDYATCVLTFFPAPEKKGQNDSYATSFVEQTQSFREWEL